MTLTLALSLSLAAAGPPPFGLPPQFGGAARPHSEQVYNPLDTSDMERLARRLLTHVALLEIDLGKDAALFAENPRTGFAAVTPDGDLVTVSHLLDGAASITVVGPKGRGAATTRVVDHDRRVAVLEVETPLSALGLAPVSAWVPAEERESGMDVMALVSTLELAGVARGVLTHEGELAEYEGFPRIDIQLQRGTPVFDDRARLVGFSRVVAWDVDRHMIVPAEKVAAAREGPKAAADAGASKPKADEPPWWSRKHTLTEDDIPGRAPAAAPPRGEAEIEPRSPRP